MALFLRIALVIGLLATSGAIASGPATPPTAGSIDPASIRRSGAGYRYPSSGWVVVHIEGTPYDRGYQHGALLAPEIADFIKTIANYKGSKDPGSAWKANRRLVDSLFLRRYEPEYLEEMKGIADGAAAAGAKFDGRAVDLLDVVAINSDIEVSFLDDALDASAHGLESKRFPDPSRPQPPSEDHCSAFAATGPATKDGKIVFGHITMWNIFHAQHFNVWLDVKPEKGHRVMMQTYPGGIQSGMDYYISDHGILAAETTISQTHFDPKGTPLAGRMRHALQYGNTIDDVVSALREGNNGLYTNEWLLGDLNTNEIAMFELGTHKDRLWRSSKNEWFGGTEGFYWGCNNGKDLDVRLETLPTLEGRPSNVVFHPSDRDRAWLALYDKHKGNIDASFGFEAYSTPPLVGFPSLDAKFTTADMARKLETFALYGPPMGKTWEPSAEDLHRDPTTRPIVPNDWTVLKADPTLGVPRGKSVDLSGSLGSYPAPISIPPELPPAWHGTILPASDADLWLAAAFADFERIATLQKFLGIEGDTGSQVPIPMERRVDDAFLAEPEVQEVREQIRAVQARIESIRKRPIEPGDPSLRAAKLQLSELKDRYASLWTLKEGGLRDKLTAMTKARPSPESLEAIQIALFSARTRHLSAVRRNGGLDVGLSEIKPILRDENWYPIASGKGTLLLAELRRAMGGAPFDRFMDKFGRDHAGKPATASDFLREAESVHGKPLAEITKPFLEGRNSVPSEGPIWSIDSFESEPEKALIVYGTTRDADAQREAASILQRKLERRWYNRPIPIKADAELTEAERTGRHLILVGRPASNAATESFASSLPVAFGPGSFRIRGETFGHEASAVVFAADNPGDPRYSIVVFAGLSAEATRRAVQAHPQRGNSPTPALLIPAGDSPRAVMPTPKAPAIPIASGTKKPEG